MSFLKYKTLESLPVTETHLELLMIERSNDYLKNFISYFMTLSLIQNIFSYFSSHHQTEHIKHEWFYMKIASH